MGREVFQGTHGKYYMVDGVKYDIHFPVAWATNHCEYNDDYRTITGPLCCETCAIYGSFQEVVITYCVICTYKYSGERGQFIFRDWNDERGLPDAPTRKWCRHHVSHAEDTFCERCFPWMSGVKKSEVGDLQN